MKTKTKHLLLSCLFLSTFLIAIGFAGLQADANVKYAGTLSEGVAPIVPPHPADYILLKYEQTNKSKMVQGRNKNKIRETDGRTGDQEGRRNVWAWVTGYSKQETCPDRECITASGGQARQGLIACPRKYKFGTVASIDGLYYECADRLHQRFDSRFDLWFGDDHEAALQFGRQWKEVIIYQ